jgi:hypothetical protein
MRTLTLLLALVASGLSIACLRLSSQLETQRAQLRELTVELSELRARYVRSPFAGDRSVVHELSAEPTIPRAPQSSLTQKQADFPQEDAATESSANGEVRPEAQWEKIDRRMQSDPKVGQMLETTTKMAMRASLPELGRHLGLDPTEEDTLLGLLARQQLERQRILGKLRAEQQFDKAHQASLKANEEHQKELAAHLGPERYQQYQSYQKKVPELQQIQELRNRTAQLDALTDYQSASLASALNEERQQYVEELKREPWFGGIEGAYPVLVQINHSEPSGAVLAAERKIELSDAFHSRVQDRAATILTSSQMERFDQMVTEWGTQERLRLEWLRARSEVQASGMGRPGGMGQPTGMGQP